MSIPVSKYAVRSSVALSCAFLLALLCSSTKAFAFEEGRHYAEDEVKVLKRVTPLYPAIAKQMHVSGKVVVDLTVNPDGSVESAQTVTGSPVLATAAVNAGKGYKFEPMKVDGAKPVVRITFNFQM